MSTAVVEEKKSETKLNQLEQLKKFTKVVADTADFESAMNVMFWGMVYTSLAVLPHMIERRPT